MRDLVAGEDLADDLDRFAHAGGRSGERRAVHPLDDLRSRGTESEQESSAGEVGEGGRRLRDRHGRASAELHDPGPEQHSLGAGRAVAQRGGAVGAP